MASRFISPTFDAGSGVKPPDGAKLDFFATGTNDRKDTFTDAGAGTPNANPVIADANGVFPDIFISGTYKVILTDKNDVQVGFGEVDPVKETVDSGFIDNLNPATLAIWQADTSAQAGDVVTTKERSAGNGNGGPGDVITGTGTADGEGIVAHNTLSLSWEMREPTAQVSTDTKTTMIATDYIPGQLVKTNGYASVLTGGGAVYLIKTVEAVDEVGSFTLANGNVAIPRFQDGVANILQYGLVADGTKGAATGTDNSTAFQALIANQTITEVTGAKGVFFFGTLGVDEILATRTTVSLKIDWGGAYLTMSGDNSITNTGMIFLQLKNINGSMGNFEFEDVTFDVKTSTGRGVVPLQIFNDTASSAGYEIGPVHLVKGQSLLTAFATDPVSFRASDIRFVGACHGDNCYYGVNLANNGDNMSGHFTVDLANRASFIYGIKDLDVSYFCREGQASSSNLLISNSGATVGPKTENIKIRAHFGTMDGPMDIVDQTQVADPADGQYKNIDVTLIVDAIGSNLLITDPLVNIGAFKVGGGFVTTGAIDADEIKIDIQTPLPFENPVIVQTQSVNYGTIQLSPENRYNDFGIVSDFTFINSGAIFKSFKEDLTGLTATIDTGLMVGIPKNANVRQRFTISATNGFAAAQHSVATYDVLGKTSSGGVFTLQSAVLLHQSSFGAAPVFTLAASGNDLTVTTTVYSDSNASMRIKSERL